MRYLLQSFVALCCCVGSSSLANAQVSGEAFSPRFEPNSVYLEILGNGVLYSVNYDRRFTDHVGGRLGFMIFSAESEDNPNERISVALIPVMVNFLVGTGSSRLELGIGPLFAAAAAETEEPETISGAGLGGVTTTFGYRYQPTDGGFVFRVGLTPFYSDGPQLWGGISVGYGF